MSKGGAALTYRVTAQKLGSLKAVKSKPVDTARWLTPTFTDEFSGSTLNPVWGMRGQDYEPAEQARLLEGRPVGRRRLRRRAAPERHQGPLAHRQVQGGLAQGDQADLLPPQRPRRHRQGLQLPLRRRLGPHQDAEARRASTPASGCSRVGENKPGSDGHEIDIIEYFGDKHPQGGLTSFIHWYKGQRLIKTGSWIKNSTSFLQNKRDGWSKNYHVFSVQWTPNVIIFYIDGKETWRTSARVSKAQQYLILSLLASDYEALELADKKLPQHMYVDWVRVWETPVA